MPRPSCDMYSRTPRSSIPMRMSACSSCSPQSQRREWKTSPVRHSEWTRTSTFGWPSTSPLTSATWVLPVSFSRKATAVNSPKAVGSRTEVVRSTSFSVRRRYSIRSATRAIVPSSFITSHTTPAGLRPARRARSTAASVCPARSSTPPGRALSGKTCPGWTRSCGPLLGSIATWIVRERSPAEIPVETPSRASIETVKAVPNGVSLRSVIGLSSSSVHRSGVRHRQMSPRPWVAMKLIASEVANWAAMVRSPSFSRSAASTTTTIFPCRMSSRASSMVAKAVRVARSRSIRAIVLSGKESLDRLAFLLGDVPVAQAEGSGLLEPGADVDVTGERVGETAAGLAGARHADHPGEGRVHRGRSLACIGPVDDDRSGSRHQHVVRMEVEVEERSARLSRNAVELIVKGCERFGMDADVFRSASEVLEHARSVDPLDDHPILEYLVHARDRVPVIERPLHDSCFTLRVPARLEPAQDALVVEGVDLRGSPLGEKPHAGSGRSTYGSAGGPQGSPPAPPLPPPSVLPPAGPPPR